METARMKACLTASIASPGKTSRGTGIAGSYYWALVPQGGAEAPTPADVYVQGQAVELPKWQGWAKAARENLQQLVHRARLPEAAARALEAGA
jgi:hypothetical protein